MFALMLDMWLWCVVLCVDMIGMSHMDSLTGGEEVSVL